VITGFGRLGHAFAAERYGVVPDMITFAKGVTSDAAPVGGVSRRGAVRGGARARARLRRCRARAQRLPPCGRHQEHRLAAGIDLAPIDGAPGLRGARALDAAFFGEDLVIRVVGDTLVLAPALVISEALIAAIVGKVAHFLQGLR
jgi:beta-alanine--pyruvate transaminase